MLVKERIPLVMSAGAVDRVNFGALETVPERFRDRTLHIHNAQVTLMRTTAEENVEIVEWIAIAMPDDAEFILSQLPSIDGFYGASSMERRPTEIALTQRVREFTRLRRDNQS